MAFLLLDMDYLTEAMSQRAKLELKETPEIRQKALAEMRQLIEADKSIRFPMDDELLIPLLRVRKFNVKRAMGLLRSMLHYKEKYEDIYTGKDFEMIKKICRDKVILVLPYRAEDGAALIILQYRYMNFAEFEPYIYLHALKVLVKWCAILFPATQVCGVKVIFDAKELGAGALRYLSPRFLYLSAEAANNCVEVRIQGMYIINSQRIVQYFWKILKYALTEKLRKRMNIYSSNLDRFHSTINPKILPRELGGTLDEDTSSLSLLEKIEKHHYYFKSNCGIVDDTK